MDDDGVGWEMWIIGDHVEQAQLKYMPLRKRLDLSCGGVGEIPCVHAYLPIKSFGFANPTKTQVHTHNAQPSIYVHDN